VGKALLQVKIDEKPVAPARVNNNLYEAEPWGLVGEHTFEIIIDADCFRKKFEPLYRKAVPEWEWQAALGRPRPFEVPIPELDVLLNDERLLRRVILGWYGFRALDPFLPARGKPDWSLCTMELVERSGDTIVICGTATRERPR
jgi:hypothetical protein